MMSQVDAAWVAGLFEGEGCITWTERGQAGMTVSSTDRDVIERLHAVVGFGSVVAKQPRTQNRKPYWLWKVGSQEGFLAVADQIEPFLMSRRTARLEEVRKLLAAHQERVNSDRAARFRPGVGLCGRMGHDKAVTGVTASGRCAECERLRGNTPEQRAAWKAMTNRVDGRASSTNATYALDPDKVREIRRRYVPRGKGANAEPGNMGQLAAEFGVSTNSIARVVTRKSWAHID